MEKYRVVLTTKQTVYIVANSEEHAVERATKDLGSFYDSPFIESGIEAFKEEETVMDKKIEIVIDYRHGLTTYVGEDYIGYKTYVNEIKIGETIELYLISGSIRIYSLTIKEIVNYNVRDGVFTLNVNVDEYVDVPNEIYTVSEQMGNSYYVSRDWFATEKEALELYDTLKAGQICHVHKGSPMSKIIHNKKMEEE